MEISKEAWKDLDASFRISRGLRTLRFSKFYSILEKAGQGAHRGPGGPPYHFAFVVLMAQSVYAGNTYPLPASDGAAEIEWITPSTFRFQRVWKASLDAKPDRASETVAVDRSAEKGFIEFRSKHLVVKVNEVTLALEVINGHEKVLLHENKGAEFIDGQIVLARNIAEKEDFIGLGPRTDQRLGAKGMVIESQTPFLISTAGYGLDYSSAGKFRFDLGKTNRQEARTTISGANRVEYLFHYGPGPKEIFEERAKWLPPIDFREEDVGVRAAARLPKYARKLDKQADSCKAVAALVHASMTGTRIPAFSPEDYPGDANIALLAQIAPMVYRKEWSNPEGLRKRLAPFLITYLQEATEKGYPMIHPLPMQFPEDNEGLERSDEFMLGDEMLVAPFCGAQTQRTVYLPRGNWTKLTGGPAISGRQTITIDAKSGEFSIFVRNGAVLPLAPFKDDGPMEMHYYPKLGGEFFIWEPDADFISQLHASPALDYFRVESETSKARVYEWVLHHMEEPKEVQMVDGPVFERVQHISAMGVNRWMFDAASKEVRVQVQAKVGGHEIVNIWLINR